MRRKCESLNTQFIKNNFSSDVIDVVKDQLYGGDYVRDEDPSSFKSEKTGRGPLNENWLDEYWKEVIFVVIYIITIIEKNTSIQQNLSKYIKYDINI